MLKHRYRTLFKYEGHSDEYDLPVSLRNVTKVTLCRESRQIVPTEWDAVERKFCNGV